MIDITFAGSEEHETAGFFQRNNVRNRTEKRHYRVHFYDSNRRSNVIEICRRFMINLSTEADMYSNAIHPFVNEDGRCGHYTYLEIFLCFWGHDNPFHRQLMVRPLTGNRSNGHHGPILGTDANKPKENKRNRNIPKNQNA